MKYLILSISMIIILLAPKGCLDSKSSGPVEGIDYKVNVLIDTVLIFDPETGKEVVKIHETRDTVWLDKK